MADAQTMRFLSGVQPRALAWRAFMGSAGAWSIQGFSMFSVIEKSSGQWIGRIGPLQPEGWPGTEVGWGLLSSAWGKGYAVEAAIAATNWAFDQLGWSEIIHTIAPENHPSQVVAQRLGSTNRGPGRLPAPYEDQTVDIWGQTRAQWFARWR